MTGEKKYFWLKLHEDFFGSLRIKRLRKMAGGDTLLIIYLKLQLKAMRTDGRLEWKHYGCDIVDELADDLDEAPDNIRMALIYLTSCGLAETSDNECFFFPYAVSNVGSEGSSAQRMREARAKAKIAESDGPRTLCAQSDTLCELRYGEIEKEKEIKTEKRKRKNLCPEVGGADSAQEAEELSEYSLILNDKTYYTVPKKDIDKFTGLYPAVDIGQEMRKMIGWCESNPKNRKTRSGISRFINSWLSRAQDSAPRRREGEKKSVFGD